MTPLDTMKQAKDLAVTVEYAHREWDAYDHVYHNRVVELLINKAFNAGLEAAAKVCRTTGIKHPQQTGQEACELAIRALKEGV